MAHSTSQNETTDTAPCLVLLGASNVALSLRDIASTAPRLYGPRVKILAAMGFGRSYGKKSRFFLKKFSAILDSAIWPALTSCSSRPMYAVVTDIGNDLAYGISAETLVSWVEEALDRLSAHGVKIVMSDLPLGSLRSVGRARFLVMRSLLFPSCALSRQELLIRAEQVSASLHRLAETKNIPIFSADSSWYGWDPIHPRRRDAWSLWGAMLGALAHHGERPPVVSSTRRRHAPQNRKIIFGNCVTHARRTERDEEPTSLGAAQVFLF